MKITEHKEEWRPLTDFKRCDVVRSNQSEASIYMVMSQDGKLGMVDLNHGQSFLSGHLIPGEKFKLLKAELIIS